MLWVGLGGPSSVCPGERRGLPERGDGRVGDWSAPSDAWCGATDRATWRDPGHPLWRQGPLRGVHPRPRQEARQRSRLQHRRTSTRQWHLRLGRRESNVVQSCSTASPQLPFCARDILFALIFRLSQTLWWSDSGRIRRTAETATFYTASNYLWF